MQGKPQRRGEKMFQVIKMIHRIRFPIDHVYQTPGHIPVLRSLHRGQNLINVPGVRRRRRRLRAAQTRGRLQMHLHRGQRRSVCRTDPQSRGQLVADVVLMRQLQRVTLGRMPAVIQLAPVMSVKLSSVLLVEYAA